MTDPLIPAGEIYPIIWVFLAIIALTLALERSRLKKYLPGPVTVIIIPCALANLGIIPSAAPEYDAIYQFSVPVGVALLLLRADIGEIIRRSGGMLGLFFVGLLASYIGISVAFMSIDVGAHGADVAAVLVAYLTGSTVNVVATAQAVRMDPTFLTAAIAGCAFVLPAYLGAATYLMRSEALGRFLRAAPGSSLNAAEETVVVEASVKDRSPPRPPMGMLMALLYGIGIFIAVDSVMRAVGLGHLTILAITVVAIAVPNVFKSIRCLVSGDRELGLVLMFLFVCAIAAQIDLFSMGAQALRVALFATLALTVHLIVLLIGGRILRTDPHQLFLASLCGVGGPPSAAAVAAAQGREDLVMPSILCGLAGIMLGNFAAVASFHLLS
ncbi:DUF819 family protein [Aurantiacibacter flavus]|uniref:DUF819 family protein n=1 Tax=Aurantiacibacter flavus TaxID=3145232 RepID=A0ABV0D005_9SPHN